jgi:hypothetical protein
MTTEIEKNLRSAKPRLLCVSRWHEDQRAAELNPYISKVDLGWDEVLREGFDPDGSPLGPVYWRVVRRAEAQFYLSTFETALPNVLKSWGPAGVAYCDPITGRAFARIETRLDG